MFLTNFDKKWGWGAERTAFTVSGGRDVLRRVRYFKASRSCGVDRVSLFFFNHPSTTWCVFPFKI